MFPPEASSENTTHDPEVPEAPDEMQTLREGIDSVDEESVCSTGVPGWRGG
jgi:hypothetical protein